MIRQTSSVTTPSKVTGASIPPEGGSSASMLQVNTGAGSSSSALLALVSTSSTLSSTPVVMSPVSSSPMEHLQHLQNSQQQRRPSMRNNREMDKTPSASPDALTPRQGSRRTFVHHSNMIPTPPSLTNSSSAAHAPGSGTATILASGIAAPSLLSSTLIVQPPPQQQQQHRGGGGTPQRGSIFGDKTISTTPQINPYPSLSALSLPHGPPSTSSSTSKSGSSTITTTLSWGSTVATSATTASTPAMIGATATPVATGIPLISFKPKESSKCPLFCCFYAEFDNAVGPKICYQQPIGFMDQPINSSIDFIHALLQETFNISTNSSSSSSSSGRAGDNMVDPGLSTIRNRTTMDSSNTGMFTNTTNAATSATRTTADSTISAEMANQNMDFLSLSTSSSTLDVNTVSGHNNSVQNNVPTFHDDSKDDSRDNYGDDMFHVPIGLSSTTTARAATTTATSPPSIATTTSTTNTTAGISSSIFDSCSEYIITGRELTGNIVNLSTHFFHILSRPTYISDPRYERNSLLFSVGFVLRRSEDPTPFRPLLSKLANALQDVEIETQFLSNPSTRPQLQFILQRILVSLNSPKFECNMILNSANTLHLKLFRPPKAPALPVPDYVVPVLLRRDWQMQTFEWDLAINWVTMHIDGTTHARRISELAQVDMEMVQACLRVLRHHGVIELVDMFFFTNRYESTDRAATLLSSDNNALLDEATEYIAKRPSRARGSAIAGDSSPIQQGQSSSSLTSHHQHNQFNMGPPSSSLVADAVKLGSVRKMIGTTMASFQSCDNLSFIQQATNSSNDNNNNNNASTMPQHLRRQIRAALAELFVACHRHVSIGDLWMNLISGQLLPLGSSTNINWKKMFHLIDHRRFTAFGLVHRLLQRVHNYPIVVVDRHAISPIWRAGGASIEKTSSWDGSESFLYKDRITAWSNRTNSNSTNQQEERLPLSILAAMDGKHCDDELVCTFHRPLNELLRLVSDQTVMSVYSTNHPIS